MTDKFFETLKALGLEIIKPTDVQSPPDLLIGVEETKDTVIFVCKFVSKVINKETLINIGVGSALVDAVIGAQKIPSEVLAITEEGVQELYQTAVDNLNFVDADAQKIEALAEKIVLGALQIMLGIVNFTRT